jgi:hypothetical protein
MVRQGVAYWETISASLQRVGPSILRTTSDVSSSSKRTSNCSNSTASTDTIWMMASGSVIPQFYLQQSIERRAPGAKANTDLTHFRF